MTKDQVSAFIAKYAGAHNYIKPSHLEPQSELYEVHLEAVETTIEDFHFLGKKTVAGVDVLSYYPKKETTDKFGNAAGISFASVDVGTRKDSPTCYVGKAIPEQRGPDGQMIRWSPAEYEYDADVRAQLDILENRKSYGAKSKFHESNANAEYEKQMCVLNHQKVGRRRADTGARAAAIISAIGMPTGFKDLFKEKKTVVFLFSRIIYNAKNKLVMDRALDAMFGNTALLAGPAQTAAQIIGSSEPESAAPETYMAQAEKVGESDPDLVVESRFGESDPRESIVETLKEYNICFATRIESSPEASEAMTAALSGWQKYSIEDLKATVGRFSKWLGPIPVGGTV